MAFHYQEHHHAYDSEHLEAVESIQQCIKDHLRKIELLENHLNHLSTPRSRRKLTFKQFFNARGRVYRDMRYHHRQVYLMSKELNRLVGDPLQLPYP